ncbi:MAG TPA: 2-oxoglutarate dehydrogenase E1 component [Candidatus Krumholzibacteria bacterium]|nr:2-oxoglutarate dehydrogenase E1 component [Candidatus Krumholzibacteria bacterium]
MSNDNFINPNTLSLSYADRLWQAWQQDPASVPAAWAAWFATQGGAAPADAGYHLSGHAGERDLADQNKVDQLVRNYRVRGHRLAKLNPLADPPPPPPELTLDYYGFTEADLDRVFAAGTLSPGDMLPLREILRRLQATYARYIGVQYMHIDDLRVREWLQGRMEPGENRVELHPEVQRRILQRLIDAENFEEFIQNKYLGAKRFSLEGGETVIPLLDMAVEHAGQQGVEKVIIGMAHRGRLNVLANILGKNPRKIFAEFEDADPEQFLGHGDVKYHLGHHSDWTTRQGDVVHLSLCFNPSHLEFVSPVALGRVRARQDRIGDVDHAQSMAILIHGDASFIGQGVTQETLNLSQLKGYESGGALHVVINNQIGFTTDPEDARSTRYCTDVAKMLQAPVFHVNGEDPEAVAQVVSLALDFRREWRRDVIIDMYCYRRRGHNETDEPAFTQPLMYEAIRRMPTVRAGYLARLTKSGHITMEMAETMAVERRQVLQGILDEVRETRGEAKEPVKRRHVLGPVWKEYQGGPEPGGPPVITGVPRERLTAILESIARTPDGFTPHRKIERLLEQRAAIARGEQPVDWAAAEQLAFGTLAREGHPVRLSGQDCQRGTFSHRHSVLHDVKTGAEHAPLQHLAPDQAPVVTINSPLSEVGVLAFEYGYSLTYPEALVMWEAQFGDFSNVAQPIIDQFITSGESKWGMLSGLVMMLPHGMEGMGPEHSSARLERFLSLAAEDNLQIAYPTTPAQMFHLLRRQVWRHWRKPLVILTPKSLLRHPDCTSSLDELCEGAFQPVLADPTAPDPAQVTRVLVCSGKIYFDLVAERARRGRGDVAILRLEQPYPLPGSAFIHAVREYGDDTEFLWVQEEPANMGVWPYLRYRFGERLLGRPLLGACRPEAASPATGSAAAHKIELALLMDRVFGPVHGTGLITGAWGT